jgi:opacity protein-like surface antigen
MQLAWQGLIGRVVIAALTLAPVAAWAAALPDPIDLASLDEVATPPTPSVWDDVPIEPVAVRTAEETRFYVTGLLGASFVTLSEPLYGEFFDGRINRSVLTTGGAAGMAFDRGNGLLRVEVEGQGRDDVTATYRESLAAFIGADFRWAANDGWSALVNVWRDFTVTEQVDLYLGGGVGAGGYRYGVAGDIKLVGLPFVTVASRAQVAAFAWQLGGGAVWNVSDRVAFDVGYRFFSIDQADTTLNLAAFGVPAASVGLLQQYTASELLFGLRIYEPFRNWH